MRQSPETLLRDCHLDQRTRRNQPIDHTGCASSRLRKHRLGADQSVRRDLKRLQARRCHPRRQMTAFHDAHPEARLGWLEHRLRRHHHPRHHTQGRQRVLGDPLGEFHRQLRQRRHIQHGIDRLHFFGVDGLALAHHTPPDNPDPALRAKRHHHELAGLHVGPGRQQIVVGLIQRDRHQNRRARTRIGGKRRRRRLFVFFAE